MSCVIRVIEVFAFLLLLLAVWLSKRTSPIFDFLGIDNASDPDKLIVLIVCSLPALVAAKVIGALWSSAIEVVLGLRIEEKR